MISGIVKISPTLLMAILCILAGCVQRTGNSKDLDSAELLMSEMPDSALHILRCIDSERLGSNKELARYALLMSMALDKNYIDTADFDVLQPAIDFYLKEGTPDEKLRTLYYQGRIYQNAGEEEKAMGSFIKALELRGEVADTLTLAHALVAQGAMYYGQYRISECVLNNMEAARLYCNIGKKLPELDSYVKALDGYIMMSDQAGADSLMFKCVSLAQEIGAELDFLFAQRLAYAIEFGDKEDVKRLLSDREESDMTQEEALALAYGYSITGDLDKAFSVISDISTYGTVLDSLKYAAVKVDILERQGKYEQALDEYRAYSGLLEGYHDRLMSDGLLFADRKHRLEVENMARIQKRDRVIWMTVSCMALLLLSVSVLYYRYRLSVSNRRLAEKENEALRLEQDVILREKGNIEAERDSLRKAIDSGIVIDIKLLKVVRYRLDMLNKLLAKEISDNDRYAVPYKKWIEGVKADREEFMNSTRMVFTVTHPEFIRYLESRSLTDDEINCVCLYAIGLIGKEVGEYMRQKSHYNISSAIRKKLGMSEHDTNIGNFIRRIENNMDCVQ